MNFDQKIMNHFQTTSEIKSLGSRGYYLTHILGKGGYSKVYRTEFISTNSKQKLKLACKLIDTTIIPSSYVSKFLPQELKIICKLNHPHIIAIHSIVQCKYKYYIFMRLAENGDLLDRILRNGPIKESLAKIWVRQISLAVQYLHILEIAHRDLKCDNILITIHNNVKLTDFGFSRFAIDRNENSLISETYCGTMSYASPQIVLGQPYNPKSNDMWSLGCVLFVMLNKRCPFDSNNIKTMLEFQLTKNYNFRTKYITKYSKEVIKLVSCLLEPKEILRIKIEQVLGSSWISMEPKLRLLNKAEFRALTEAIVITKRNSIQRESLTDQNYLNRNNSINYLKEYDEGYDLTLINSEINDQRRLSN